MNININAINPNNPINANNTNLIPSNLSPTEKARIGEHLSEKLHNNSWLGKLILAQHTNQVTNLTADSFPYTIKQTRPYTKILDQNLTPIEIGTPLPTPAVPYPSYMIAMPCVPDFNNPVPGTRIQNIINAIETDGFGLDAKESQVSVTARTALIIGLNTFYSIDSSRNHQFKAYVENLTLASNPSKLKAPYLATRIIPFFWSQWNKTNPLQKSYAVDKCYMLAKSFLNQTFVSAIDTHLQLKEHFGVSGTSPIKTLIPYQEIRNKITHSPQLNQISAFFFKLLPENPQYVLSLDSDFISLKTDEWGFLSYYDAIVVNEVETKKRYPHVMSTGYSAPANEQYILVKLGVELDRDIRTAVAKTLPRAVYMPEPNFAFLVNQVQDLQLYSWTGKSEDMATESRCLIKNAIKSNLINPETMIFLNGGSIQTEIDDEWHTKVIKEHLTNKNGLLKQKGVQKALRGLHQSYCDPQIWSNNIYSALGKKITAHMTNAISPMKVIRNIFDPYMLINNLTTARTKYTQNLFDRGLSYANHYASKMNDTIQHPANQNVNALSFAQLCSPARGQLQTDLFNLFNANATLIFDSITLLRRNYTQIEIDKIVKISQDTGEAIKRFLQKNAI